MKLNANPDYVISILVDKCSKLTHENAVLQARVVELELEVEKHGVSDQSRSVEQVPSDSRQPEPTEND